MENIHQLCCPSWNGVTVPAKLKKSDPCPKGRRKVHFWEGFRASESIAPSRPIGPFFWDIQISSSWISCPNPSHSAVPQRALAKRLGRNDALGSSWTGSLRLIQASSQSSHSLWMSLMCPSTSSLQKPGGLLLPPHSWPVMVTPKASPSSFSAHFFPVVTSTSRCPAGFVIVSR